MSCVYTVGNGQENENLSSFCMYILQTGCTYFTNWLHNLNVIIIVERSPHTANKFFFSSRVLLFTGREFKMQC